MKIQQLLKCLLLLGVLTSHSSTAQEPDAGTAAEPAPELATNRSIEVEGIIPDRAIQRRIFTILQSSGWFDELEVKVSQGIVMLGGRTQRNAYFQWAEAIAVRTEDVVAVMNNMEVKPEADWTFEPALIEAQRLLDRIIGALPLLLLSAIVLLLTLLMARAFSGVVYRFLAPRLDSDILRRLVSRICSVPVFIFGIYIVLNITGLGNLAATVIGGTGLLGLVIGIAFRDITENFLASILISVQRPFKLGDFVKVGEFTGFVQAVTTRGTVLMTDEGNHVQIPNSVIYKQPIINYSANPLVRLEVQVGIGYDASIAKAQALAMELLQGHPAALDEPEPLVLVDKLAASTVNLRMFFWVNAAEHSVLKVKSSVLRLLKRTYIQHQISMPDDAREVIFPQGLALSQEDRTPETGVDVAETAETGEESSVSTCSEGTLTTDAESVKAQARRTTLGENNEDALLKAR